MTGADDPRSTPADAGGAHPSDGGAVAATEERARRRKNGLLLGGVVAGLSATLALVVALGTGGPDADRSPTSAPTPIPTAGQRGVYPGFGPQDVFTTDISSAPVQPNSAAMIENLRSQIEPHYGGIAALNTNQYNPVLYVVDQNTPRTTVKFDDCQKKGYTPPGLFDGPKYFVDVPIPAKAQTSTGTDSTITLWSPSTDQLWEFWVMKRQGQGWSACWGGRIDHVSQSPGYFPPPYGVSASGLVTTGSMITIQEAKAKKIDHAMGMALIRGARWDRFWYPAQRSDGSDPSPNAIPQGARLRLDPSVDVDSLKLTPLGKAIAKAAQKYGFVVVDTAGSVAVMAESGLPDEQATGKDPWDSILGGVPNYKQLENFPWDKVQVVEANYGKPAGTP